MGAPLESSCARGINGDLADNGCTSAGAVYVFTRTNGIWSQQAYVKASNTDPDDRFGASVALLGDTLAVGSEEDSCATGTNGDQRDNGCIAAGAVYVFTRTNRLWTQQAYLKASNTAAFGHFSWSVALSGNTLAVGAYHEESCATDINGDQFNNDCFQAGAVYVFTQTSGAWNQQAYVKASNAARPDEFGASVALNGDTLAVGAPANRAAPQESMATRQITVVKMPGLSIYSRGRMECGVNRPKPKPPIP